MLKKFSVGVLLAVFFFTLTACGYKNNANTDILTQKIVPDNKIPITVLVKYAFSINTFEKAAEEKFPQLDIIQVGNYTLEMGIAEYEARLKHDDLTDIIMTWPVNVGEEYFDDRLLDLSSQAFSGKYNTAMLNDISSAGKLYYLPGPSQVRGIVYNKTLFKENGWVVPDDFEGFINLCQTIEKSGIRSLQLGLGNSEVLDTAFVGYSYAESFSKPEDAKWLADYNEGKGDFGTHFATALDTFQTLIDTGVLQKNDLNVRYAEREQMLFTRKCAMVEDSVLLIHMGYSLNGSTDEFGLMPFFNPCPASDWARLYPVCYIGINKHLAEAKNKEKYDLVMQLLEYISTPAGQEALVGDTGAMFSSLKGIAPPDIPEISDLLPALTNGRYAVFPTLKNAQAALRQGLAGMVAGTLTTEDVIKMVNDENISPPIITPSKVIGTATKDFTLIETGNFVTDAMRSQSGSEIALFLDNGKDGKYNGKGISARWYQGDLTFMDINRIFPDLKKGEKGELWKITMSGENLIKTLEYSLSLDNHRDGWFYYFSGLRMEYAPAAEPGKRIKKITDSVGNAIEPLRIYTIAVMDDSIPNEYILSCEKQGLLIIDMLAEVIQEAQTISPSEDDRFIVCLP